MNWLQVTLLPLSGLCAGWIAARIAVTAFLRRGGSIAAGLGDVICGAALRPEAIGGMLNHDAVRAEVISSLDAHLERVLRERLPRIVPAFAVFMNPGMLKVIRDALEEDVRLAVGELCEVAGSRLGTDGALRPAVRRILENLPQERVEELVRGNFAAELRCFEIGAAALGFLIGAVQVLLATALQ